MLLMASVQQSRFGWYTGPTTLLPFKEDGRSPREACGWVKPLLTPPRAPALQEQPFLSRGHWANASVPLSPLRRPPIPVIFHPAHEYPQEPHHTPKALFPTLCSGTATALTLSWRHGFLGAPSHLRLLLEGGGKVPGVPLVLND